MTKEIFNHACFVCDACHEVKVTKHLPWESKPKGWLMVNDNHLCPECAEEYEKFINGGRVK